jgi:hypothetical protein
MSEATPLHLCIAFLAQASADLPFSPFLKHVITVLRVLNNLPHSKSPVDTCMGFAQIEARVETLRH